jgi:hypothetical protein
MPPGHVLSELARRAFPDVKALAIGEASIHEALVLASRNVSRYPGPLRSIFQSKDDPEIGLRLQYSMILKSDVEEAAERPISFCRFLF